MSENQGISKIESLILMAMDSKHSFEKKMSIDKKSDSRGYKYKTTNVGSLLPIPDRSPSRAFTFDGTDEERLFCTDLYNLTHHPFEVIGNGSETILLMGDMMKWVRIEPIKRPKKFSAIGRADRWFAMHYKTLTLYGDADYVKNVCATDKKGVLLPTRVDGWTHRNELQAFREKSTNLYLMCSIIEDAHRTGSILAEASVDNSIVFPMHYGAHKDFLKLREAPRETPTGRLNPIIHFCKKHIRKKGTEKEAEVKGHWKGKSSVTIDGMTLTIEPEPKL